MRFGEWLKEKRIEADLTQTELGEKIGASRAAVWTWESETSAPKPEYRKAIEKMFGPYRPDATGAEGFGEWLREARERMGLTQAQLSEKSGVSQITISFIETGRTTSPRQSTVELLTKVLGAPKHETAEELKEAREVEGLGEYLGPFPISEWENNVEPVPAVYVLYDSINRPVRIGQTKDISRRLKEYADNYWWFRSPTVVAFAYVVVPKEETRKQIEKTIIKFLGSNVLFNVQDTI